MSLTLNEVKEAGLDAWNYTEAFHDEVGCDWRHWCYYPPDSLRFCPNGSVTDAHDRPGAGEDFAPYTGWIHAEGCTCQFAPRCMEGVKTHDRVEVTERDDDV